MEKGTKREKIEWGPLGDGEKCRYRTEKGGATGEFET